MKITQNIGLDLSLDDSLNAAEVSGKAVVLLCLGDHAESCDISARIEYVVPENSQLPSVPHNHGDMVTLPGHGEMSLVYDFVFTRSERNKLTFVFLNEGWRCFVNGTLFRENSINYNRKLGQRDFENRDPGLSRKFDEQLDTIVKVTSDWISITRDNHAELARDYGNWSQVVEAKRLREPSSV